MATILDFLLSYHDIVEILRDRGITVHHTTIMQWIHHYRPILQLLWHRHKQSHSQSWQIDETYIKIKGYWCYLYRGIDSQGLTLDSVLRKQRDCPATCRFLERLLKTYGRLDHLVTDRYSATLKAIKQVITEGVMDRKSHQCSRYRNNLIEQDHDIKFDQLVFKPSELS